eukprot:CAMPEP_0178614008 /NCGR_PEP_ID=MMETSP0698-20121128/1942_1 /TAXON_ID=265572 /ORGANISM="Extubocellulus spinifer, Strain CCMP396" /LENGTH=115 /DNA_ID=CAMNT_0020252729 /DNA_START=185 /DNA_END=530 /DNA_ORIENTATION=-
MKIAKDVSTHLFKYVKSVDIRFNPFDGRAKSAKELLRQVSASRYSKANPKLVVTPTISSTAEPPRAEFKFVDGSERKFDSQEFQVKEILSEVFQHTTNMDNEYEIAGKSIDDDEH